MVSAKKGDGSSKPDGEDYAKLSEYSDHRRQELSKMFSPVVE